MHVHRSTGSKRRYPTVSLSLLARTVVAVAQEIIRRYRRVLIELSAVHIDTLIHIARNSTQLRPFVLGILSELVARPCARAAAISADVEHPDGTFLTLMHCFESAPHGNCFTKCLCELCGFLWDFENY